MRAFTIGQSRPAHVFPLRMGEHAALSILFTLYFTKPFNKAPHVFPCGGQVGVALKAQTWKNLNFVQSQKKVLQKLRNEARKDFNIPTLGRAFWRRHLVVKFASCGEFSDGDLLKWLHIHRHLPYLFSVVIKMLNVQIMVDSSLFFLQIHEKTYLMYARIICFHSAWNWGQDLQTDGWRIFNDPL